MNLFKTTIILFNNYENSPLNALFPPIVPEKLYPVNLRLRSASPVMPSTAAVLEYCHIPIA